MENLNIFENADKYFVDIISDFKDILSNKVVVLKDKEWIYDKGIVKPCSPDETGKKKRCKIGLEYSLKIELSIYDVDIIWDEFSKFFGKTIVVNIERNKSNEGIGRYEFIAKNSNGDEIVCMIYLHVEWNIPQISILAFVSSRYREIDYKSLNSKI